MNTRLLSKIFILSLCVAVGFSARSRSRNADVSDQQRRRQQHFQEPPVKPSSARQTDSGLKLDDQWASSGDEENSGEGGNEYEDNEDDDVDDAEENEDNGFNGYDENNNDDEDEDEDGASGDGGEPVDVPVITKGPLLTRCQNMSTFRLSFPNAFRPQCTAEGAFAPMQCHHSTGECWCVDTDGNVIGNLYRAPMRPNCSPNHGDRTLAPILSTQPDDIGIDDPKTSIQPSADIRSPNDDDDGENPGVEPVPPKTWYEHILHHPLLLTAVIAGSVLFLVIVVLMLMFCVYRMRKKDEGSYSLDEPRQTFNYTRAKDQEFFA